MIRRFIALLLFAISFQCALVAQSVPAPPDADALTDKGKEFYRSGRFKEAADAFRAAMKADPTAIMAGVGLVRADLHDNSVDEANATATALLQSFPNSALAHVTMGDVLFRRAVMADAEKEYQAAIKLDKTEGRAYF